MKQQVKKKELVLGSVLSGEDLNEKESWDDEDWGS